MASGPLTSHTYLSAAVIGAPLLLKISVPVALPPAATALNDTATVNAAAAASVIFVHEFIRLIWASSLALQLNNHGLRLSTICRVAGTP
jgi:hypothetical protein